jgi:hypothetical protein
MADVIEYNAETGEVTTREYTAEEIIAKQADQAKYDAYIVEQETAAAPRIASYDSALAKLAALGLTADEIAAITK